MEDATKQVKIFNEKIFHGQRYWNAFIFTAKWSLYTEKQESVGASFVTNIILEI